VCGAYRCASPPWAPNRLLADPDQQLPSARTSSARTRRVLSICSCVYRVRSTSFWLRSTLADYLALADSPLDPDDTLLPSYLIATWAKVCQAMGAEFELYLPIVMPPLLQAAAAKTELSVYGASPRLVFIVLRAYLCIDEDVDEDRDGWETLTLDGRQVGIRTAQLEEKCQALETLVVHCSTLGPRFAPYLMPTLELTLPMLRFHFHEGVQEAACMFVLG
jgi:hypothetical protein